MADPLTSLAQRVLGTSPIVEPLMVPFAGSPAYRPAEATGEDSSGTERATTASPIQAPSDRAQRASVGDGGADRLELTSALPARPTRTRPARSHAPGAPEAGNQIEENAAYSRADRRSTSARPPRPVTHTASDDMQQQAEDAPRDRDRAERTIRQPERREWPMVELAEAPLVNESRDGRREPPSPVDHPTSGTSDDRKTTTAASEALAPEARSHPIDASHSAQSARVVQGELVRSESGSSQTRTASSGRAVDSSAALPASAHDVHAVRPLNSPRPLVDQRLPRVGDRGEPDSALSALLRDGSSIPTPPAPRADAHQTVQVSIGRIEIRQPQRREAMRERPAPPQPRRPSMSLDDYLKRRNGGGR